MHVENKHLKVNSVHSVCGFCFNRDFVVLHDFKCESSVQLKKRDSMVLVGG